jgi:hypothetical protein
MSTMYGEIPAEELNPPLSPEALRAQLGDIDKRLAAIEVHLKHLDKTSYEYQELVSERALHHEKRRHILDTLNPRPVDPTFAKCKADHEAYVKQLFQEPSAEELAARKRDREEYRQRAIEAAYAEQSENLKAWIAKLESEQDWRQSKIWQVALANLRATLERQIR